MIAAGARIHATVDASTAVRPMATTACGDEVDRGARARAGRDRS